MRESIVFAEEGLDVFPCHDAGPLLMKAVWVGAFEDADIVAEAVEYDAVEEASEGATDLLTDDSGQ